MSGTPRPPNNAASRNEISRLPQLHDFVGHWHHALWAILFGVNECVKQCQIQISSISYGSAPKEHAEIACLGPSAPVTPPTSMSSKATRTLIRTHHNLEKRRVQALAAGDTAAVLEISKQIEQHGGIKKYQRASLLGQASERGGDSSKVLMDWLKPSKSLSQASEGMAIRKRQGVTNA